MGLSPFSANVASRYKSRMVNSTGKTAETQKIADLERAIKDYIKTGKVIGKEPRSKVKTVRRKVK